MYGIPDAGEKQVREQNLLLACVLHEFKTSFSIIQNTLHTALKTGKGEEIPGFDETETIITGMLRDIENILDMETLIRGKWTYSHTAIVNVSEAVNKEIKAFTLLAQKKEMTLTSRCEETLYCKINPGALGRILHNLLDNAIKYTPRGGEIHVSLASTHDNINLAIEDTGKGIGKEDIKHIFKPYYRGKTDDTYVPGMGLGLFLVKYVADSAGGTVEARSKINKGTVIAVQLPRYHPGRDETIVDFIAYRPLIQKDISLPEPAHKKSKFTLLIVDDDRKFLRFMHNNLMKEYNIYLAEDGSKALEMLSTIPKPDIIVSDIIMGGMDGYELYKKIIMNPGYSDIPVLFLSAKKDREKRLKSLQNGVIDYIFKPFSMDEVKAKIESIVRNRQKTTEMKVKQMGERIKSVMRIDYEANTTTFEDKCREHKLSRREEEVVQLTLGGKSVKDIASKLGLSVHTVRNHTRHIYKKCGVKNKMELLNLFRV
jgi:DNA-binding NarL/FixJ family response regulator/two-component sensor histidine kinase